jgi:hypothetical protein
MEEIFAIKSAAIADIQNTLMLMDQKIHAATEKMQKTVLADPKEALSRLAIPLPGISIQSRIVRIDQALNNIRAEVMHALGE